MILFLRLTIALFAVVVSGAVTAASLVATVDQQRYGLPLVSKGGASAVAANFVFWGKSWAWADTAMQFKLAAPYDYTVTGKNQTLAFDMSGRIRGQPEQQQLVWEFDLNAQRTSTDVIGGGISFKFDLETFRAELGEPELLPGNRGWAWGRTGQGSTRLEMRFEPPLAAVFFERNQKSELRAYFYSGEVPQGNRRYTAVLKLIGDVAVGPTIAERLGPEDLANWPADIVQWNRSPVDLSFLNANEKPAGRRGWVKAQGDKLVFEDGTEARFWGTNLTAYTLFQTTKENVRQQARRLSELGFNLVRLHHHDSAWVDPNIFGNKAPDTQTLSKEMLERVDWWIKCLKDEGIYVWLDLHVGREFRVADGIDNFAEIAKGRQSATIKGFNYINDSIKQAMKRFNEAYVTHVNVHTGVAYKDEPAIMGMLLTNENDIVHHFGNALLPDKGVPKHNAIYMSLAEAFANRHGLQKEKVWRSWEPGPSKLFLNDLERRFNLDVTQHLRSLGVKALVATTSSWGENPLSTLPALTSGDVVNAHAYGGIGELEKDPAFAPNLVNWLAAAQVVGRPFTVTEWNVDQFPAPDRHAAPLQVASSASMQGWSALMHYAYAQIPLNETGSPSPWHAFNDPGILSTLPAAALLFRQRHVSEATSVYAFAPNAEQFFGTSISVVNSPALRSAAERGKLVVLLPQTKELPWLESFRPPPGAHVITSARQSLLPPNAVEVASDSGQLKRNWGQGTFTVDTARTQAAAGWIGGRRYELADVEIAVSTRSSAVWVQSLDGSAIKQSRSLLVSLGARTGLQGGRMPYRAEPVVGRLAIRAPRGLKLYKHIAGGAQVPVIYQDGRYLIDLEHSLGTYWLFLR